MNEAKKIVSNLNNHEVNINMYVPFVTVQKARRSDCGPFIMASSLNEVLILPGTGSAHTVRLCKH